MSRTIYEHLLQGIAGRIFQAAVIANPPSKGYQASKLNLVAFGTSTTIYEVGQPHALLDYTRSTNTNWSRQRTDSKSQRIYFRSTHTTAEGKQALLAVPLSGTLRPFVEPRSDVLDFSLRNVPRMPVKDWDVTDLDSDED